MKQYPLQFWLLSSGILLGVLVANSTTAQIIPDTTLPSNSIVTPQGNTSVIEGGNQSGGNLFHSFKEFSLPTGDTASFNNTADVQNILSRVTGGKISNIDGLIRANGGANLFLINPNGIIFGPNARLDIGGSFVGSTASSINFADGTSFSATAPQTAPLLTINVPIGLQYGVNPGRILVQGQGHNITYSDTSSTIRTDSAGLQVKPNQTLALIGGDVVLEGGNLRAESGRIELGSVALPSLVSLIQKNSGFAVGYTSVQNFGDIQLAKKASVDTSGESGGEIQISGRHLTLRDGSAIFSITSGAKPGRGLIVNTSDSVELVGQSADDRYASSLFTASQGSGAAGDLTITTRSLKATDGAVVSASTFDLGNAGNLTIRASDLVEVLGTGQDGGDSSLAANVRQGASGNGGDLTVETRKLVVTNGSQVSASTFGKGDAGNLTVRATDSIKLSGETSGDKEGFPGGLFAQVNSTAEGKGGNLTVETGQLSISDGSTVQVDTFGQGNAGNLLIRASNVDVTDTPKYNYYITSISAEVGSRATGDGGNLTIEAGRLSINNEAEVSGSTFGKGNAGNLTISASDSVEVNGEGGLYAQVNSTAEGKGGNLTIDTGRLSIKNGGTVATSTFGEGDAGRLLIKASDLVEVLGTGQDGGDSSLSANVSSRGRGQGGDFTIDTRQLVVRNSQLSASTFGEGNAGNLTIRASESVELSGKVFNDNIVNPAGLFAQVNTTGEGKGGNLTIETGRLSVSDGSRVQVATFGQGNAGDLFIRASDVDVFETPLANFFPAGIFAGVEVDEDETVTPPKGNGGNLAIESDRLSVRDGAAISVTTQGQGDAGILRIRASESVDVAGMSPNGKFKSEISAAATPESTGSGGSLQIETGQLTVRDRGTVSVRSQGLRQAGNLDIQARSINLDNQGNVTATTRAGNGGNIYLGVRDLLLMRRSSQISTTAGSAQGGGNGGNITINAPNGFLVAFPNEDSDITANAFSGSGGNIQIITTGIYGTQFQEQENQQTSDITASSQLGINGTVQINTPDIDPSRGVIELPTEFVDPAGLIASSCLAPSRKQKGSFVITGSGGLPTQPDDPLNSPFQTYMVPSKLEVRSQKSEVRIENSAVFSDFWFLSPDFSIDVPWRRSAQIVEAQGMYRLEDGQVVLGRECLQR